MVDVAIEAATRAGELALRYFEHARNKPSYFKSQSKNLPAGRQVSYKPDGSPVTRADIEAEKLIRKIISKKFPDHGIIGEELPPVNPKARFQWVIDPIDGTRDFVRGINTWGTFLAILENQKPLIGIIYYPPSRELFSAQKGKGTYFNDKRIRVSRVRHLKQAALSHGAVFRFGDLGFLNGLSTLTKLVLVRRNLGTLGYNLLLKGELDIVLEPGGYIHDFAAPAILITEAGGKFSDFEGKNSLTSGNGLSTNGLLHQQVLKILNET